MTMGMKSILNELSERAGIRGAILVTRDGMIVTHSLRGGLDEELLAALSTSLIQVASKSLAEAEQSGFERFILTAEYGRLVLMDIEFAFLVVVVDKGLDLDRNMVEVFSAARRVKKAGMMKPC